MASGLPVNIAGFAQEIANIIGINNWNLQEASYNGAVFHWMQPSYNGLNPLAGLTGYVESAFDGSPQKPPYGTWSNILSIKDTVKRKLCVFPVPNYNGYYIEDFGATGSQIDIVGLVYGPDYEQVLTKCQQAFNDTQIPGSNPPSGIVSGNNFRQFVHPVFGSTNIGIGSADQVITNVYFVSYEIITSSDKWRAASFRMQLIAQNANYLSLTSIAQTWQSEVQNLLNLAQNIIISINQAVALINSINQLAPTTAGSLSGALKNLMRTPLTTTGQPLPVITGRGLYVQSIEKDIDTQLANISLVFQSSMAFFVQNSAGQIQNSFWDAIRIDFTLLPVYLTESASFSYSDAQAVISNYADAVSRLILFFDENGYQYAIQSNIEAMKNSVVYLNNVATLFLSQNNPNIVTTPNTQSDLYSLLSNNNLDINNFSQVNDLNRGSWFSCLKIPPGTMVNLS